MSRTRPLRTLSLALLLLLALALPAAAQEPQPADEPAPAADSLGDPARYDLPADTGSEGAAAAAPDLILAQPPATLNYQGYLTDNLGAPFDGAADMSASLYNAAAAGSRVWGPEDHAAVPVDNGHFHLVLGATAPLEVADFSQALWLGLTIAGTEMPRQPLRPSAYALGLVPGARMVGDLSGDLDGLTVSVAGGPGVTAIYASGTQYGLYAEETGGGDAGVYTPDFVEAAGYRSSADSYVVISPLAGVPEDDVATSGLVVDANPAGWVELRLRAAGARPYSFYIPVNLPTVLLGQAVTVEQLRLYYRVSNANSFITAVQLVRTDANGAAVTMLNSTTDLKSTTATAVDLTPSAGELASGYGPVMLRITVDFDGPTTHVVALGGARLRLGHR